MKVLALLVSALVSVSGTTAFVSTALSRQPHNVHKDVCSPQSSSTMQMSTTTSSDHVESTRRSMLQHISLAAPTAAAAATGLLLAATWQPQAALASGGATAGGAYLLSAKQRYNERVTKGLVNFMALGPSLQAGDLKKTQEYFVCNEPGCWLDCSTAGYLLANAFRRSASTNPDSLPAVKAWKAYAKAVGAVEKSLKKNKAAVTLEAYNNAVALLDGYLEEVELPASVEMKK